MNLNHNKIIKQIHSNMKNLTFLGSSYIDKRAKIGRTTKILQGSIIMGDITIKENNIIGPYAIIGTPPQHSGYYKGEIKSNGSIVIGNGNIIREYTTIHASTNKTTVIGDNCFLMAHTHVPHDAVLEDNVTLTNNTQIAGHSYIMEGAIVGLNSCVHQYSTIGAYTMLGMGSIVTKDIPPFLIYKNFKCYKINKIGGRVC